MTLRTCAIVLTALVVCSLVDVSAAADITGKWTANFDTQIGEQKYTYDFQVKGSQLTGTASSENGQTEIKNGKVDQDTVTFVESLNFQGMVLEISYTARSSPPIRSTSPGRWPTSPPRSSSPSVSNDAPVHTYEGS